MAVQEVTDSSFQKDVLDEKDKLVLVDFWAEWCGPCRMLAPVVEAISEQFKDQINVFKIDTDANAQTAQNYQITGIPCVLVFKQGEEIARLTGYRSQTAFATELEQYLN